MALVQPMAQVGAAGVTGARSSSLANRSHSGFAKTPGGPQGGGLGALDSNKSPLPLSQLVRLPNGQVVQAPASQLGGSQTLASKFTPHSDQRALTPGQRAGLGRVGQMPSPAGGVLHNPRSMSPMGNEIPGEKKFVEVNTKEQLIISTIGMYASKKGEDRYVPLQNPQ